MPRSTLLLLLGLAGIVLFGLIRAGQPEPMDDPGPSFEAYAEPPVVQTAPAPPPPPPPAPRLRSEVEAEEAARLAVTLANDSTEGGDSTIPSAPLRTNDLSLGDDGLAPDPNVPLP